MRPAAANNTANRSDQVRQRRTSRSRSRIEKAAHTVATPQVTVRGAGLGSPVLNRTASRPRRVYTVAFQNTGRAYSVPAPTLRIGWRALSALLLIGFIAMIVYGFNSETFQVEAPIIEGAERIHANEIDSVLKLSGRSVFSIDPFAARVELQKSFPELDQVSVLVGLPNVVSVQVSERTPVVAWQIKDQTLWVDARGTIFKARGDAPENMLAIQSNDQPPLAQKPSDPAAKPEATAAPNKTKPTPVVADTQPQMMDLKILSAALLLRGHMPADTTLLYSEKEGLGWNDARGWDVYFGKTLDDLEMKISMYQAIIDQLSQKKITPVYINLVSLHTPYYRLER